MNETELFNKIVQVPFSEGCYYKEETKKTSICLHHTASSNSKSDIEWWQRKDPKTKKQQHVSTPFIIDKDGTIKQLYSSRYWAHHCLMGDWNKSSIGIEIVNEGYLTKTGKGDYLWYGGTYNGEVYDCGYLWRGYKYWARYTDAQIESCAQLCAYLIKTYNIPVNIVKTFELNTEKYKNHKGIINHHNLQLEKTDPNPSFPYDIFEQKINEYLK